MTKIGINGFGRIGREVLRVAFVNPEVEIVGNDELKSGTNEITIKVSVTDEAGLEEQKTYTIKVQKEEEPVVVELTTIQKIQNFFGNPAIQNMLQ